MSNHTPGPWRVSHGKACGGGEYLNVIVPPIGPAMPPRAKFFEMPYGNTATETDLANANLIAAAPDMLEALEGILNSFHESVKTTASLDEFPALKAVQAAINKAKGNQEQPCS